MMTTIEPSRRTLRGQAHAIIREELVSGLLRPGDRINEVELGSRIGVSRGTVREALRTLEQEGLLFSVPHRGTFVRKLSAQEAAEVSEVRLALETAAAYSVSQNFTPERRELLEARFEELKLAVSEKRPFPERLGADHGFHEAICIASGNETLLETWKSIMGPITAMVLTVGPESMSPLHDPVSHQPLLDTIEQGANKKEIMDVFEEHFAAGNRIVQEAMQAAAARDTDEAAAPA